MVQYITEALVLRSRKYKEADAILTLLTKERGKINAVARSIYKPTSKLRAGVQPYSLNIMQLNAGRSSLQSVNQSECQNMFMPLRNDLSAMAQASYWAELLDCFAMEEQPDDELFQLAIMGFESIANNSSSLLIHALEIRLIRQLGLAPSLDACASCGRSMQEVILRHFSAAAGGMICEHCAGDGDHVVTIKPVAISLWKSLENIRIDKLDRIKVQPDVVQRLDKIIKEWIVYQSGRPMKSWQVFNKMGGVLNE
jgi:DNA repair protein RecO (recombination protein O)